MDKLTLVEAQRLLLGIVTSVEAGVMAPEEAQNELTTLKQRAALNGFELKTNLTLSDFESIFDNSEPEYDISESYETSDFEETFDTSTFETSQEY